MTTVCADAFQPIRMDVIWPIVVGGVLFIAIEAVALVVNGKWTRWQAMLASAAGIAAAVVTSTIARHWDGSDVYWLSFTMGLAFVACILVLHAAMKIILADTDA